MHFIVWETERIKKKCLSKRKKNQSRVISHFSFPVILWQGMKKKHKQKRYLSLQSVQVEHIIHLNFNWNFYRRWKKCRAKFCNRRRRGNGKKLSTQKSCSFFFFLEHTSNEWKSLWHEKWMVINMIKRSISLIVGQCFCLTLRR